jgi:hypothetical protein
LPPAGGTRRKERLDMEPLYHTLHDFMLQTKTVVYLVMAGVLVALPMFWCFLTGRDEKKRTY